MDNDMSRNAVIRELRKALKARSGKDWSVTGGRGTAYGWLTIEAPPRRRTSNHDGTGPGGYTTPEERAELGRLLGLEKPVHCQGESIPASSAYYRLYLARARTGTTQGLTAEPYWD
jgi:hypothetical protein